jgi:hypothetical protein
MMAGRVPPAANDASLFPDGSPFTVPHSDTVASLVDTDLERKWSIAKLKRHKPVDLIGRPVEPPKMF